MDQDSLYTSYNVCNVRKRYPKSWKNNFQIPLWQKMAEQMPPENKEEYIEKIIMKMEA